MTDAERAAAELAETLRRVNQELADNSRVSQTTMDARRDAEMKAKYGVENFTAGTAKGAEAVVALASSAMAAGKAMLDGKKGAAAFNSTLDGLSTAATAAGAALALMVPVIGPLVAGVVLATKAFIKYTQAANEMADKLYTGYSGLAKSGAAASDGMTGVKNGAQKLGLSMDELSDYVQIVSENSKDLANFGGSVYKGRQALENMGKAMEPARESMLKMGLMPKDIAEGMAGYLRTQTRLGNAQKMSVDQLAEGARKYLIEQDALTKLTGVQRSEREKAREEAMMEEQHAGVIRELQMQGERGKLEADRVQKISDIANDFSPAIAKMIRSLQSGVITDEGAKLLQSAPNAMRDLALAQKGQISELEAIKRIFGSVGESGDRFRASLAKLSANDDTFVSMGETTKARIVSEKLATMSLEQIKKEQEAQGATGKKAADALVEGQAKLIDTQIRANQALTNFIADGIGPAQEKMRLLAEATLAAGNGLNKLFHDKEKGTVETVGGLATAGAGAYAMGSMGAAIGTAIAPGIGTAIGAALGGLAGGALGYFTGGWLGKKADQADKASGQPPGRAAGGPVNAGKLYKVGERGEEFFRPNVAGEIIPNDQISGIAGAANNRVEIIQRAAQEIADDTATLAKLTDVDLKKTQDASRLQDRLRKLKTELAIEEVELLEEQKDQLTKMLDDMEKTMGKDAVAGLRKNIIMQRAMGGGSGLQMPSAPSMPSMGGGSGLQMPSAPSMPSMGGGQGLQIASQDDLKKLGLNIKAGDVQADNAKISPKLIELAKAIQGGVPGFGYFSSFNDKFHNEKAPSSKHTEGIALDFTVAQPPSIDDGKAITSWLKSMGASVAIDEYNSPTAKSTGGHFHAQLPTFADGGTLGAGQLGIAGEAGKPELITGPAEITPINELMKAFGSLAGVMAQSVDKLDELVRAQKTNNDISNKILRVQQ
jgi:hypothetical protein